MSSIAIGGTLRIGEVPFTVIAVLAKKGQGAAGRSQDDVVFIPLSTAQSRVVGAAHGTSRAAVDFIAVKMTEAGTAERARKAIREVLRSRHHLQAQAADDFTIENPAEAPHHARASGRFGFRRSSGWRVRARRRQWAASAVLTKTARLDSRRS